MIIGGVVFGILFDTVFGMLEKSIAHNKNCAANKFIQKFDDQDGQAPSSNSAAEDDTQKFRNILINLSLVCAIVSPALIIGHYEGWTFGESIYFAIVTATTGECRCLLLIHVHLWEIHLMSFHLIYINNLQWGMEILAHNS